MFGFSCLASLAWLSASLYDVMRTEKPRMSGSSALIQLRTCFVVYRFAAWSSTDTSTPAFLSMVAQYSGPSGGQGAWIVPAASGAGLGQMKLNFMVFVTRAYVCWLFF